MYTVDSLYTYIHAFLCVYIKVIIGTHTVMADGGLVNVCSCMYAMQYVH